MASSGYVLSVPQRETWPYGINHISLINSAIRLYLTRPTRRNPGLPPPLTNLRTPRCGSTACIESLQAWGDFIPKGGSNIRSVHTMYVHIRSRTAEVAGMSTRLSPHFYLNQGLRRQSLHFIRWRTFFLNHRRSFIAIPQVSACRSSPPLLRLGVSVPYPAPPGSLFFLSLPPNSPSPYRTSVGNPLPLFLVSDLEDESLLKVH